MSKGLQTDVAGGGVNLSYIITPFLDMSFQLLAFFIMTYHPSALEGHVDGTLVPPANPVARDPKRVQDWELPAEVQPDLTEMLVVKIKAVAPGQNDGNRHDGEPSQILLQQSQDAQPVLISDSTDATLEEGLKKLDVELKRQLNQPGGGKFSLKIDADANLRHLYVMRVYDVCKLAGCQKISFAAPKSKTKS